MTGLENRHHCDLVVSWCTQGHIGSSSTGPAAGWIVACPSVRLRMVDSWLQQKLRRQVLTLFSDCRNLLPCGMVPCPHSNGGVILADSDKINCVGLKF